MTYNLPKCRTFHSKNRSSWDPTPERGRPPSSSQLPKMSFSGIIFFLMVTLKVNMAHVYISKLERSKFLSTSYPISPKETKRFYPFTVTILRMWKGHGARALFSPISLLANWPRLSPTLVKPPNNPHFCRSSQISYFPNAWVTIRVG